MAKWKRAKAIAAVTMASAMVMTTPVWAAEEYDLNNPPVVDTEAGQLRGFMNEGTYTFPGVP